MFQPSRVNSEGRAEIYGLLSWDYDEFGWRTVDQSLSGEVAHLMWRTGGGSSEQQQNGPKEPGDNGKEEPKENTGKNVPITEIREIIPTMPTGGNQGHMNGAMDNTTRAIINEIRTVNSNITLFRDVARAGWTELPDPAFMSRIEEFHRRVFREGSRAIDTMFAEITEGRVAEDDRELFSAYVNALRGMSYVGVRHDDKEDYTSTVNLGNGAVSVEDLLQTINNLTGETFGTDGQHPRDAMRKGAISLLADDGNERLAAGVITMMGNLEQYMGLSHHIQHERNMRAELTEQVIGELSSALGTTITAIQLSMGILDLDRSRATIETTTQMGQ